MASPFGRGNAKLGPHIWTYSQLPGATCPGESEWCNDKCYAKRMLWRTNTRHQWTRNTDDTFPDIPRTVSVLRLHVGGDFHSVAYIDAVERALLAAPWVTAWAYTHSWRSPRLRLRLEALRRRLGDRLQLFASTDPSTGSPPSGWRVAHAVPHGALVDAPTGYRCPEQSGRKPNCESCRYCFDGRRGDVIFTEH